MTTLYMCVFEGCGFDIIRPMILKTPYLLLYWYVFIFLTAFGIFNVVLGLFCETVIASAEEAEKNLEIKKEEAKQEAVRELKGLWNMLDRDGSETISHEEFTEAIETDERVMACLEKL